MNKTINIFLNLSGILFWLLAITLILPFNMGFFGMVGVYMMMFGYPFVFFALIILSFILSVYLLIETNKFSKKEEAYEKR